MTRQLSITAAEWASVQPDGTLWLVREGVPAEFVQACAPCEVCNATHEWEDMDRPGEPQPCTLCRIELVGPCSACGGKGGFHNCANGTVILGCAYPVGQPLPIVLTISADPNSTQVHVIPHVGAWLCTTTGYTVHRKDCHDLTVALAHYGPPETLVGRWAVQLRVVQ